MAAEYREAEEVKRIARNLIPMYHPHFEKWNVRIEYLFVSPTPKAKGNPRLGYAQIVTSMNAFLSRPILFDGDRGAAEPFGVITIAEDEWFRFDSDQQKALVDHELCHLGVKTTEDEESGEEVFEALTTLPHDLEEFRAVVDRHGLWLDDLQAFPMAMRPYVKPPQVPLAFSEEEPRGSGVTGVSFESEGKSVHLTGQQWDAAVERFTTERPR